MNFFEYTISPFIFIIKHLFLFAYNLTNHYGWAIILLSFFISLLLLPVFIYIEREKKKTDKIKRKMQPLVDEIKRCYKGQERYYYLRTLNRQHNFSQFKAMLPILSLLLQIPFFIAAYQYLEHFQGLKGVSFLFIKDLSQPDGLFGYVNILPIIMTLVNLLTAYFYTRNGDKKEMNQMIAIAVLFLVLLFNLPAGLVLYWTMNNIFSFLRLFITNPEVFKKQDSAQDSIIKYIKHSFVKYKLYLFLLIVVLISSQLYWAFNHDFNDIYSRIILSILLSLLIYLGTIASVYNKNNIKQLLIKLSKPSIFYSLLFLSIYFYLAAIFYFSGFNKELASLSVLFLTPIEIVAYYQLVKHSKNISLRKLIIAFLNIILFVQFIHLLSIINGKEFRLSIFNINISSQGDYYKYFITSGLVMVFASLYFYVRNHKTSFFNSFKPNIYVYLLSVFYLTGFIFLWNPLSIYSSDPDNFVFPAINILKENIFNFLIYFITATVLYLVSPLKIKQILYLLVLMLTILGFYNNTIHPIYVGSLQETKFLLEGNLSQPVTSYLLEGSLILIVYLLLLKILKKSKKIYLIISLSILNIILIANSLVNSINTNVFFKKTDNDIKISNTISFSKDKENVVMIVSDMFYGWYIKKIVEEQPALKQELSGFKWYPNTISVSPITCTSMPVLIGGYNYTIDKLNTDKHHTMYEKMTRITENFVKNIKSKSYRFTGTDMIYSKIDKRMFDTYLPKWSDDWNIWNDKLKIGATVEIGYSLLWENATFYTAPLFLKPLIYNKSNWFNKKGDKEELRKNTNSAKRYNFLRLLPKISKTNSKKPSFIYIHTMASHHPWCYVDDNGIIHNNVSPYENNKWVIKTLSKWFNWMKKNGVYDNTKIILVSDHGIHWWHFKGDVDNTLPIKNIDIAKLGVSSTMVKVMYPLLLVKDYNKNGSLKKDMRFMSNADASYIALNKTNPTNINYASPRKLPSFMTRWTRKIGEKKYIKPIYSVYAYGSAFDISKWKIFNPDTVKSNVLKELFNGNTKSIEPSDEEKRQELLYKIKNNEKWYNKIKLKAAKYNRTVEEQLNRDINWILKQQKKKK